MFSFFIGINIKNIQVKKKQNIKVKYTKIS